jgi:FkbM family methyltransferase
MQHNSSGGPAGPSINPNLVFDIGTSEGNDTQFYLDKGFSVVSVEADPLTYQGFVERFSREISEGRVTAVHAAAASKRGETVTFYRNDQHQGLSSLKRSEKPRYADTQSEHSVTTVDYATLVQEHGIPHYCKVDIEGGEGPFVSSMTPDTAPEYISVEIRDLELAEQLFLRGYRRFKLVDQKIIRTFEIPFPPLEGKHVPQPNWGHATGLFGRELPGEWVSFSEFAQLWSMAKRLNASRTAAWTWYDCHAWKQAD